MSKDVHLEKEVNFQVETDHLLLWLLDWDDDDDDILASRQAYETEALQYGTYNEDTNTLSFLLLLLHELVVQQMQGSFSLLQPTKSPIHWVMGDLPLE